MILPLNLEVDRNTPEAQVKKKKCRLFLYSKQKIVFHDTIFDVVRKVM